MPDNSEPRMSGEVVPAVSTTTSGALFWYAVKGTDKDTWKNTQGQTQVFASAAHGIDDSTIRSGTLQTVATSSYVDGTYTWTVTIQAQSVARGRQVIRIDDFAIHDDETQGPIQDLPHLVVQATVVISGPPLEED